MFELNHFDKGAHRESLKAPEESEKSYNGRHNTEVQVVFRYIIL